MKPTIPGFSLGICDQDFWPGIHICQIFDDDAERLNTIYGFLQAGFRANERGACFSDGLATGGLSSHLAAEGRSLSELTSTGSLTLSGTRESYFAEDRFDPDRMVGLLRDFYLESIRRGHPAARVIGEMIPEIERIAGGERLVEYETKVSRLQRECPVTTVCQYDAHRFGGATIMAVLKVHPYLLINGAVVENPLYLQPESILDAP